jgi:hypothetical protein
MAKSYKRMIKIEEEKYLLMNQNDKSIFELKIPVINTLQSRRLQTIKQAPYGIQHKLKRSIENHIDNTQD